MDSKIVDKGEILVYQTEDGTTKIDVTLQEDTVWLCIGDMVELFQRDKSVISRHINNIFKEGELEEQATVAFFATVQREGTREVERSIAYYNLDVIISVGYRVKSHRGTQFRRWAMNVLKEYLIKGFAMNDALLKQGGYSNYFDELLERIRDIRSSEKVFWRKVLDIYATSIDYDPRTEISNNFFKTIQNKMHWAAHGHTAAEIIVERANVEEPFMGLTSFKGKKPTKSEVTVAKNYLTTDELDILNRIVTAYLEFAELQAMRKKPMYMNDWIKKLDSFLELGDYEILQHAGKVSSAQAIKIAQNEYVKYKELHKNDVSIVEEHFFDAIKTLKDVEKNKK